ncbi:hypothetical protein FZC79_18160 [Rossellomorea vietnamensis]|uniref:Uncharacterized protein n=2 Tax=Rossellomorea TaxID=2837508 RepID=A0A5D4K872_9BACI|nr:hypothetical protein FZC79_18160 [Rossellomorea vietnamensis]TYS75511.1 hypothetical protein FZC80_17100 [Rossellomorea aquimaris]
MLALLSNLFELSGAVLLFCSLYFYRKFKKMKRKGELSAFEVTVLYITRAAIFLCAGSYLLLFLDRTY